MKTQNSTATKGSKSENKNAASQQVKNTANTTRRVVETRDQWQIIFDYSVKLIVAYCRNQKPSDPRSGFGFGSTAEQPHSRAYAKSLIWGFSTNKAGKVLKNLDEIADKSNREKIAIAILSDCKLVKGETKDIMVQLNKVEPKRERMIAESVLQELTKPTEPTTPKGGKGKAESQPKAEKAAPKGGKATTKGGKKSSKPAAPKGSKAEDNVVYDYIHFKPMNHYGVVTVPTTGKFENELETARIAYKRFLEERLTALRPLQGEEEENDYDRECSTIQDTLNSDCIDELEIAGWSNVVTPKEFKGQQVVIIKKAAPKGAKAEGKKATTKSGNGKKSTTKGGKAAKK